MENNCEKHAKGVAGILDMKVLAEQIGDLHYEVLADLLDELALKIYKDSVKDGKNGRSQLAGKLNAATNRLVEAHHCIKEAWEVSKKFMTTK